MNCTPPERHFLDVVAEHGLGPGVGECQEAWGAVVEERERAKAVLRLNLNQRVRVKLTEEGLRILDKYERSLPIAPRYLRYDVDPDRAWKGELWRLMAVFGDGIYHGMDPPFEGMTVEVLP